MDKGIQTVIITIGIILASLSLMLGAYSAVFANIDITKAGDLHAILTDQTENVLQNLLESEVDYGTKTRGVSTLTKVMEKYNPDMDPPIADGVLEQVKKEYVDIITKKMNKSLKPYIEAGFLEEISEGNYVDVEIVEFKHPQVIYTIGKDTEVNRRFYNLRRKEDSYINPDWDTDNNHFLLDGDIPPEDLDYTGTEIYSNYEDGHESYGNIEEEMSTGHFPEIVLVTKIKPNNLTNTNTDLAEIKVVSRGKIEHRNLKVITR